MTLRFCAAMAATVLALASARPAAGAVLVYEGYSDYAEGALVGQTPTAATVGLDLTIAYNSTGSQTSATAYTRTTGLTFGNLEVAGDAVLASGAQARLLTATLDLADYSGAASYTGTLFGSYLINIADNAAGGTGSTTMETRFSGAGGNSRFVSAADSPQNANNNPGVGYNNTSTTAGTELPENETFLVLAAFTHVGETLNDTTTVGEATQWILTETQFAHFKAGGLTAEELNGAAIGTAGENVFSRDSTTLTSGTFGLVDGATMQLVLNGTGSAVVRTATFDELRYGSSLDDVTPVPEPGTAAAAVFAGAVLLRRRRFASGR